MAPTDFILRWVGTAILASIATACLQESAATREELSSPPIPRGYYRTLQIERNGALLKFGPFVGYHFRPIHPNDLSRLEFLCFNEERFYASGMPENARLFEGEAVFQPLSETEFPIPDKHRINPVFFPEAPPAWLEERPRPQDEFLHFHSCYDQGGAVSAGFWLRHRARSAFLFDMGGRVGPGSPLYHRVRPGPVRNFARIIEFDHGPKNR